MGSPGLRTRRACFTMNIKERLDQGAIIFVEIREHPQQEAHQMFLQIHDRQVLESVPTAARAMLLAFNRAWSIVVRRNARGHDTKVDLHIPEEAGITLEELVPHVDRSYQIMQELWPFEAWFVDRHIHDERTAALMYVRSPVFNGLWNPKSLIPNEGAAGYVVRTSSPASYFPTPKPEAREPRSVFEMLLGANRDEEPESLEIQFPVPQHTNDPA